MRSRARQDSPIMSKTFSISGKFHPHSVAFCQGPSWLPGMCVGLLTSVQSLPHQWRMCWSSSKYPWFPASSSPLWVNTAWASPCFPFLSCWTVCQNLLGANQKSFSISSPNILKKTSRTEASSRRSQFTLTASLGLQVLSYSFPCLLILLNTRSWSVDWSAPLFMWVSKTFSRRSDNMTTK